MIIIFELLRCCEWNMKRKEKKTEKQKQRFQIFFQLKKSPENLQIYSHWEYI